MADPISLMAVAGLVYAGRTLSTKSVPPPPKEIFEPPPVVKAPVEIVNNNFEPVIDRPQKREMESFGDITMQQRSGGQEILNMRNRLYDQGRMNNLSPIEKQLVGPGLGVSADTPAVGGYQQMFRVNPENVGAYRLTTLPGRSGPAYDSKGGRRGIEGEVSHNRPEKTAFMYGRLPPVTGRAQGMSGRTPRGEHEKTKRTTNRSETGLRADGLSYASAKRTVSSLTRAQEPTRNKKDGNMEQYQYANQPAPGVSNFMGGYVNAPASKIGEKRTFGTQHTVEELMKYGFRPDDRRGKAGRAGGPGRMNVRADALNQGGM